MYFEAEIIDLSSKGLGLAKHPDGRAFFVAHCWPGDYGKFKITKEEKRYGFAELVELIKASKDRNTVSCKHLGTKKSDCGGCPWMIATYPSQLEQKQKQLEYLLNKFEFLNINTKVLPIQASSKQLGYRNRVSLKTDGKRIGYISPGTKDLAAIDSCVILSPHNQELLANCLKSLPNSAWIKNKSKYQYQVLEFDSNTKSFSEIEINKRIAFQQANDEQNQYMKDWLIQRLDRFDNKPIAAELFCGAGNFSSIIASRTDSLIAVEGVESAIQKLKTLAIQNIKAYVSNIYQSKHWTQWMDPRAELLILDPPREGFPELNDFLLKYSNIKTMIYISCNAQSFAQDCKDLKSQGWELNEVQALDQFPHTPHFEVLSYWKK